MTTSSATSHSHVRATFSVVGCVLLIAVLLSLDCFSQAPQLDLRDKKLIADGGRIFAKSCSVGYCHGKEGRAGRGPRLRDREFDPEYLFQVTWEGVPNSSMPAWNDRLTREQVWAVVAYIMTLSGSQPATAAKVVSVPPVEKPTAAPPAAPGPPKVSPVLAGDAKEGQKLFFDATNDLHCASCHQLQAGVTTVGPNLSKLAERSAKELFQKIVDPNFVLSTSHSLQRVTLQSGEILKAVFVEEDSQHIRVFDVTAFPPVLRTLNKSDVRERNTENRSAMPGSYADLYSVRQLLDLIAFIQSQGATYRPPTVRDLF
ncbi:MAG: c-type cytochrome [Acidobacteriota bacterium]